MPLYVPGGGGGASALDDLTDVDTTTTAPVTGDRLYWDGTNWIPASLDVTISFGGMVTLTNVGAAYDSTVPSQGLGIAKIDLTNYSHVDFYVMVNKVGAGTQSWQLWDDTFNTQIAVINDSGAAGVKSLSSLNNVIPALSKNLITVRVRAQSTTATDDPVFLGATARFQRHP